MKRIISSILALFVVMQLWGQDTIEVVNIENQAVQDYMEDARRTYEESPDYRESVITKYNNAELYGSDLHRPQGKLVQWIPSTTASNIKEVRITVSENSDYSDAYTFHPNDMVDSSFVIRNLLPNCVYYYKVEELLKNGTTTEMTSGAFRTVGQVRMIYVPNCKNIRDLGGWPTQYGVPVKYGRLYRSGSLDRIKSDGRRVFVDELKVLAELDLRHEVQYTTSFLGSNKDYLRIPHGSYMTGLTQQNTVYVKDLMWIIERMKEDKNVDWHCAIGCDRCGTLSFLIEGLLGLNELDLCRDYELSTLSLSENNKRVRTHLKSMIDHIRTHGPKDDLAQCFYNYWLSIGMGGEDLDYFLQEMLDVDFSDSTWINTRIEEAKKAGYSYERKEGFILPTNTTSYVSTSKPLKYKVKRGDSLGKIAKKHGTTVKNLKRLNNLKSDLIREGQVLIVKKTGGQTTTTNTTKAMPKGQQEKTSHIIKKGETLGGIAKRYHVTVSELKKWNKLKSDKIVAGKRLIINK